MTKQGKNLPQKYETNDLIGMDGELRRPLDESIPDDLPHNYADKKRDTFRPRSPELHFTTSLYIDRAIELLYAQAEKANDRRDLLIIKCSIDSLDADRARFKLESLRMGKMTGRLEGTIQRWEGSLIRVDVDVQHFSHDVGRRATLAVGGVLGLGVVGALVVQFLCMQALGVPPEESAMPLVTLTSILALIAVAIHEGITQTQFRRERITDAIAQRDVDELITILTNTFGEHNLQWVNRSR